MSTCHGGSQSTSSGGGVSAAAAAAAAAAMDNRVECPHCGRKFGETQVCFSQIVSNTYVLLMHGVFAFCVYRQSDTSQNARIL